jgi:hypothetical protein
MSGKTVRAFTIAVLLMAGGMQAAAETPSENVTVTATRSREVLGKFTRAFATPTEVTGKMARWERRVCPVVVGQNGRYTTFITQHIKYVALAAGAPVNTEASCRPNIEIVFTTTPQALLDAVRKDDPIYLGYAATSAQEDALATVTRPIQAWYTTETVDLKGIRSVDSGLPQGEGVQIQRDPPVYVQRVTASNGNHIDDGIHTGFNHILIVIDSARVAGQDIVPLADYISMLALTQLGSLDACQELPSVVNILAPNCGHAADGITEFDLAYLQGLYKMRAGRSLMLQRNAIADAMTDMLAKVK